MKKTILLGLVVLLAVGVRGDVVTSVVSPLGGGGGGVASAVTPGTTTALGCQNLLLYGDNSQTINCEAGLGYDATNNQILAPDGSIANPSYAFTNSTGLGFYRSASNIWNEVYGGSRQVVHTSTAVGYLTSYQIGWYSASFAGFDTGLSRNGVAGVIRATDGGNGIRGFLGGGAAVASATALPVPTGAVFHVTGTTTVTSLTTTNLQSGACFTMIFDGVLTFTDGNNLVLAGNFVTSAGDTLTGCFDGTNFYETSRSNND